MDLSTCLVLYSQWFSVILSGPQWWWPDPAAAQVKYVRYGDNYHAPRDEQLATSSTERNGSDRSPFSALSPLSAFYLCPLFQMPEGTYLPTHCKELLLTSTFYQRRGCPGTWLRWVINILRDNTTHLLRLALEEQKQKSQAVSANARSINGGKRKRWPRNKLDHFVFPF